MAVALAVVALLGSSAGGGAVVGGGPADASQWSFVVPLLKASEPNPFAAQFCAASLVAPDWAVTAAHCVEDRLPAEIQVASPRSDLTSIAPAERVSVDALTVYPLHPPQSLTDDLAMVHLSQPVGAPASLARGFTYSDGYRSAAVAGWGISDPAAGAFPDILLSGQVTVLSSAACAREDPFYGTLCGTRPQSFQASACNGDSGGPLAVVIPGQPAKLLGVVSYGDRECDRGKVSVYTDVGRYRSWIVHVLRGRGGGTSLPELTDVKVESRPGQAVVHVSWCQAGAAGHRIRVDVGVRGVDPGNHLKTFRTTRRRRAAGECGTTVVRRPGHLPAGRYALSVKLKDTVTGMATPGPEMARGIHWMDT